MPSPVATTAIAAASRRPGRPLDLGVAIPCRRKGSTLVHLPEQAGADETRGRPAVGSTGAAISQPRHELDPWLAGSVGASVTPPWSRHVLSRHLHRENPMPFAGPWATSPHRAARLLQRVHNARLVRASQIQGEAPRPRSPGG